VSDAQQPTPHQTDLEIARIVARAHERDRYLAALLAPARERDDLIVLAAFAGEVARIPPLVTEPLMGEIRLQWWRDALQNTTRAWKSGHPVADRMRETAARHHLPQGLLLGFIDAHAGQLYDTPLPDEAALKAYLARSDGALFELGLRILGRSDDLSRELAAAAGQAYGLVRNLTELPALLAQGRMLIPADQLAAVGVSPGDLPNEGSIPQIAAVLAQLLAEARDALAAARRLYRALPRVQRVAVLPVALVEPYLRALENVERNPLRDIAELTPLQRIWPLFRSYWSGQL
jgi:phytoene synthase